VSPQPIDTTHLFSRDWTGFSGPAIGVSYSFGGTSGRFEVAEIIARVFPAYKAFVTTVTKLEPTISFQFGPDPADTLTYRSKAAVEYTTPAHTEGLGTRSSLKKNGSPMHGVAILVGQEPDLLLLAVRLPSGLDAVRPAIVGQVERDAARHPRGFDTAASR
jgi:hypothetical protein